MKINYAETNKFLMDFINWDLRKKGEKNFFIELLKKYNCKTVFNSALGDGYDTINLMKTGFQVISNEVDPTFREQAKQNAAQQGIKLENILDYDWRAMPDSLSNSCDALICLGNSIAYLMNRKDQLSALTNFYKILRPGGIAVIDTRNYDYMLDQREHILKDPLHNFSYSGKYYYGGDKIKGYPIIIEPKRVIMEYLHLDTGKKTHLELYPFRRKEFMRIMNDSGLKVIESYGDFNATKVEGADFYQIIGRKE